MLRKWRPESVARNRRRRLMSHLVDQSQAGVFDPYSDDPRLAVKKLAMCPVTGLLAAAGTAGQIVIAELSDSDVEKEISVSARWSSFRFFVNVCVCVCVCVCFSFSSTDPFGNELDSPICLTPIKALHQMSVSTDAFSVEQ